MKKLALTLVFCTLLGWHAKGAAAQDMDFSNMSDSSSFFSAAPDAQSETKKIQVTDPFFVSMIFYKVAGKTPDFRELAMKSEEYLSTPDRERVYIIDSKIQEFKNVYDLINLQEPIIIEAPVLLSKYNEKLKGFFIKNFSEGWYYPIESYGRNYALIPEGLMDLQWMKVEDKNMAEQIRKANARSQLHVEKLSMMISLEPIFANAQEPSMIDNKPYWTMSARVQSMKLMSSTSSKPLWELERNSPIIRDDKLKDIIKTR